MINLKEALDMYHGRGWDEDIPPDTRKVRYDLCSNVWRDPNSGKEYSYDNSNWDIQKERKHETMKKNTYSLDIKNVIFNPPATIVFWDDGDKTIVKCGKDEPFDPEKGLAMAIAKRVLGQHGSYYNHIKKWTKSYNDKMEREKESFINHIFEGIAKGFGVPEEVLKGNETTD